MLNKTGNTPFKKFYNYIYKHFLDLYYQDVSGKNLYNDWFTKKIITRDQLFFAIKKICPMNAKGDFVMELIKNIDFQTKLYVKNQNIYTRLRVDIYLISKFSKVSERNEQELHYYEAERDTEECPFD